MKYKDNITEVAHLQPDYLGFIFYEKSSRFFDGTIPELSENITKVGVFVNTSVDYILGQITKHNLKAVQLHGNESPGFCNVLRQGCHSAFDAKSSSANLNQVQDDKNKSVVLSSAVEIIKVFSIKDHFDFSVLKPYEEVCDYFLFDTKGKLPGGNGYTFNWDILNAYPSTKPFFLSGGISLDDVEKLKAFNKTKASKYCYAIDVNSKFEIEAGLKNKELLKQFKTHITSSNF